MLHYYLNLYNGNINRAVAVSKMAQNQFDQFEQYLNNSIDALKKKQISATWKKIETPNLAELRIIGGLYQYTKQTVINITGNRKGYYKIELLKGGPNFSKKIEYQIGSTEGEANVNEELFQKGLVYLEGVETEKFDAVRWGFADVELTPAWLSFKVNMMLNDSGGVGYKVLKVNNDDITILGDLTKDKKLFFDNTEISFTVKKPAQIPVKNVEIIPGNKDGNEIIFYSEKRLGDVPDEIKPINKRIKEIIDFNNIVFASNPHEKLQFTRKENSGDMTIVLQDKSDYKDKYGNPKKVISKKLQFEIVEPQLNNVDKYKIQLEEIKNDNDSDDEPYALSPLRYFFSENDKKVNIKDNKKNKYFTDKRGNDKNEYQIVLHRESTAEEKAKRIYNPFCLPEGTILHVQVNTRPLEHQSRAVSTLKRMPHKNHEMLIRLFEKKDGSRWERPANNIKVDNWFVLKEKSRSGCDEQRKFVEKALNTPEFAILEGPPGSGKTTAILELICQLVLQKKRVLLCGSTNVAIDNILERLIEKNGDNPSLLEQIDILPVRIGRAERVDQNIVKYQIDNLIGEAPDEQSKLKQSLLLDAANLVCGTTTGIIDHPKFRDQNNDYEPIVPEFHYLIIDECSKTTFQEFLVPALYSKRWILAGDVMQLSPFTDQEGIDFNFEQIMLKNSAGKNEILDKNIQKAVFYLEKIRSFFYSKDHDTGKEYHNRFILPCSSDLLEKIVRELVSGRIDRFTHDEIFICITKDKMPLETENSQILLRTLEPETINFLELTAANLILVESVIMDTIIDKLPATHAVIQKPDWETMPHAFCHNVFQQRGSFGYFPQKGKSFTDSFEFADEINNTLKKRSWAQEIAWRIDSENQLRLANKSKRRGDLGSQIDEYTPYSVDRESFEEARDIIAAMSFPSILESLVEGIKGKKPKDSSTISDGFYKEDLDFRKITLTFQHRMHSDISVFPRGRFYKGSNALLDLESPKHIRETRQWDYDRYEKRSMWVDVKSPTKGSKNIYEVEAMMRHLKDFLEYAVKNPQPEGKVWTVACLAFYRPQEEIICEGGVKFDNQRVDGLRAITGISNASSNFKYNEYNKLGPYPVYIRLHSVDRFQGHEADFVLLSMSQTNKDGFLDNPNRLNVGITRAKFQLLIFGKYEYFSGHKSEHTKSEDLKALALSHENSVIEWRSP